MDDPNAPTTFIPAVKLAFVSYGSTRYICAPVASFGLVHSSSPRRTPLAIQNTSHGTFPPFPDLTAGQRYLIDCEGCGAWGLCENCNLTGDTRVPVCAVVLDHSTSPAATGTLEELGLEPGYWRATNTSKIVRPCYNGDACVGGAVVAEYCSEGYEGPCERSCVRWCSWSATQEGATCGVLPGCHATYNNARRCQAGRREFLTQTAAAAAAGIVVPDCTPFVPFQQPDCAVCEEGYAPGLSFSCSSCSDEGNRALRVFVAAVIVVLVVAVGIAVLVDLTTVRAKPERKDCCPAGFRGSRAASVSNRSRSRW